MFNSKIDLNFKIVKSIYSVNLNKNKKIEIYLRSKFKEVIFWHFSSPNPIYFAPYASKLL